MERQSNSGKDYSDAEVKYLISLLPTDKDVKQAARKLKRTPLQIKTALRCAMGDRARGSTGWDKFDRAARNAKVVRVASGLAQESWNKLRPMVEQFYEQSNPGVKSPIEHKVDYFLKINSEAHIELMTPPITNGEAKEQL